MIFIYLSLSLSIDRYRYIYIIHSFILSLLSPSDTTM